MKRYLIEFIGVFFLVFTIGMTVIAPGDAGPLAPFAIGSILGAMIYVGGHISGAHYNPAVSIGVTLRAKLGRADFVPYVLAQIAGACVAAYLVRYLKGEAMAKVKFMEFPNLIPVFIVEFLFTFALVLTVLCVATAKQNEGNSYFGLAIGTVVTVGALAVGSISGGAFNPAVVIGLMIMGIIKASDMWIHLSAECFGGILAALVFIVCHPDHRKH